MGIVDGVLDGSVVGIGTLGVSDILGLELVDENNLMKFGEGHSDGKLIKAPGFKAPDLAGWLGA